MPQSVVHDLSHGIHKIYSKKFLQIELILPNTKLSLCTLGSLQWNQIKKEIMNKTVPKDKYLSKGFFPLITIKNLNTTLIRTLTYYKGKAVFYVCCC